jgi:hypothetical protein
VSFSWVEAGKGAKPIQSLETILPERSQPLPELGWLQSLGIARGLSQAKETGMQGRQDRMCRLGVLLLALILAGTQSGCVHMMESITPVQEHQLLCKSMPAACRNHVNLFFINGYDPLDCVNLSGLKEHLEELGYIKVYLGYFYHSDYFYDEIQRIHHVDPLARFVILGASHGAVYASELARRAASASIPVDLLVSLDGDEAGVAKYHHAGVLQVLHIHGDKSSSATAAGNLTTRHVIVPNSGYWSLATRPETIETMLHEVTNVASHVTLIQYVPVPVTSLEPTPRAVLESASARKDDWDFLVVNGPIPQPKAQEGSSPGIPATTTTLPGLLTSPPVDAGKAGSDQGPLKRPPLDPGRKYLLDDLR